VSAIGGDGDAAAAVVQSVKRYGNLAEATARDTGVSDGHVILYGGDHDPVYYRVTVSEPTAVVTADHDGSGRIAYVPTMSP
jgi:hypothetical protein